MPLPVGITWTPGSLQATPFFGVMVYGKLQPDAVTPPTVVVSLQSVGVLAVFHTIAPGKEATAPADGVISICVTGSIFC